MTWLVSLLFLTLQVEAAAGFHLTRVEKDSIYSRLGMQEGDVLQSYNGKPIQSEKDLKTFLELLQKSDSPTVKLIIDRKGQHKELVYNFGEQRKKLEKSKRQR